MRIHGVPVLGDRHAIPEMVVAYKVNQVIIAMPTASGNVIREIVALCDKAGVETRIVPGLYELLGGEVSVRQLREVQIEDLLRREPVQIDAAQVAALIARPARAGDRAPAGRSAPSCAARSLALRARRTGAAGSRREQHLRDPQ